MFIPRFGGLVEFGGEKVYGSKREARHYAAVEFLGYIEV
jgi:hypothetical protein